MKILFCLLAIMSVTSAFMVCVPNSRFPWMKEPIFKKPWSNYEYPNNKCCDETYPFVMIDFDEQCGLCYSETHATPGFMLDPNDCQKFFMCTPRGDGLGYISHHMTCPDCMFWDDEKLSCVEVADNCAADNNNPAPTIPTGTPNPEFVHEPLIGCIDFENEATLTTGGIYAKNNGVRVLRNGVNGTADDFCPSGQGCGHFSNGNLHLPIFSNSYGMLPNLKVTMKVFPTDGMGAYESLISNDCYEGKAGLDRNSMCLSLLNQQAMATIVDKEGRIDIVYNLLMSNMWHDVEVYYTGDEIRLTIDTITTTTKLSDSYSGLHESHCPMVIGSLIKDAQSTFFQGYMDNICFEVDYEYPL